MGCTVSQMTYTDSLHKQTAATPGHGAQRVHVFTDKEKHCIRRTWKVVSNDMPTVGGKIFEKIFHLNPQVKQMFSFPDVTGVELARDARFRGHAFRFMQVLGASVDNIGELDDIMGPMLLDLGSQHYHYPGFKMHYFDVFIIAILDVFAEELGSKYNEKVYNAWRHVVDFIIMKLKEGCMNAVDNKDRE